MTYEDVLLALTIWREARGEGLPGMQAVAHVILNRGGDLIKTLTSKNQFSSMSVLGDPETILWPQTGDASFATALGIATQVRTSPDPTGGAVFYLNQKTATSPWFLSRISNGRLIKTVSIGKHTFYKET